MSSLNESNQDDTFDFQWKKKRGVGGKNKDIQFYESFTFDGMEYSLYDDVYFYIDEATEPYIGKLIKIWEMPDKAKKVKALWFFRPFEISNCLNVEMLDKELFLASGEGKGLANINPLEVICGKCSVVCTSKDSRNFQPSSEDIKNSDYIFYRTFDVGSCEVIDKIPEMIAGIEAKFLLNIKEKMVPSGGLPRDLDFEENFGNNLATSKGSSQDANVKGLSSERKSNSASESHASKMNIEVENVSSGKGFVECDCREIDGEEYEGISTGRVLERKVISAKQYFDVELDNRPSKKLKVESFPNENKASNAIEDSILRKKADTFINISEAKEASLGLDVNDIRVSELEPLYGDKVKSKQLDDSALPARDLSQKMKSNRPMMPPNATSQKISPVDDKRIKDGELIEVTRRPKLARSKWFRDPSWDDKLRAGLQQEAVLLLQNLDPSYTSAEVEDIVWHAFQESCTAKMLQRIAISSPHSGQALVVFKTKETADIVAQKLEDRCLMLSNGRPIVGSVANITIPERLERPPPLVGHLFLDKAKILMQRADQKEAVSTSHCSQPNTIEYEMAMEWCLLQARSDSWWMKLYKGQGDELNRHKAEIKSK